MSKRNTTRIVGLLIVFLGLLGVVGYVYWPRPDGPVVNPGDAAKEKEWQAANENLIADSRAALTELAALGIYMHKSDGKPISPAEYGESELTYPHVLRLPSEPKVTSATVAALRRLPKLSGIDAHETPLDDAGLALLSELENLNYLNLNYTLVSDAGVAHIVKLPTLNLLGLNGTNITDASADVFAQLPALEYVSLFETQVGDKVLASLATLEKLRFADVQATQVSLERAQSFSPKQAERCTLLADPY